MNIKKSCTALSVVAALLLVGCSAQVKDSSAGSTPTSGSGSIVKPAHKATPAPAAKVAVAPVAAPSPKASTAASTTAAKAPLTPAAARAAASKVLLAEDAKLRAEFEKGATLTAGAQTDWWLDGGKGPLSNEVAAETIATFQKADAYFTAADEPASISEWRNNNLAGDLLQWYQSDTGQGQDAALTDVVSADLDQLDASAQKVAKGA